MIKLVIFDLDGTLLNTLNDIHNSLNIVLNENGFESKTQEETKIFIGNGVRYLARTSLPLGTSEETINKVINEFRDLYYKDYNIETKPYKGIKELLNELQKRNVLLGVNSNKPHHLTIDLIKKHFPGNSFIAINGFREEVPRKPDPSGANEIIKLSGLKKEEVLYIGDTEIDIQTAKAAGIKFIGSLWGFRNYEALKNAGGENLIFDPMNLLDYIN